MRDPRRSRWWALLWAAVVMGMMSALGGTWEAPLGAPLMLTPRGTAPLPPNFTPVPSAAPGEPQPPAPPVATATPVGAPVGIAPAAPTATPEPPPPPEPTATTAAPPVPTATTPASLPTPPAGAATATATPPSATPVAPQATATAVVVPTITATRTATPPGLIAGAAPPAFPAVQPQAVDAVVQPGSPVPVTLALADRRITVAVAGNEVREPVRLTLAAASYVQGQREAALRQGLLLTNAGFTVTAAPVAGAAGAPPEGEITVRYSAAQVSGINEATLGLYRRRATDGAWDALTGCKVETTDRQIVCRTAVAGDFLLAGAEAQAFDAAAPTAPAPAAGSGAADGSGPNAGVLTAIGALVVLMGAGAALLFRTRRVRS